MIFDPVVQIDGGALRGLSCDGVVRFAGVPYAQPMRGMSRWQAPVPPVPWDGVRDATRFGATAPSDQSRPHTMLPAVEEPRIAGDEYLNLNVWTARPEQPVPVLVWIHGGGFFIGSSANPWYDGSSFAQQGLVVVSINYRLGAEGFAVLDGAPNNRAVLDWIAALEWVRRNIRAFGGDPDQVTIMGQSAGGFAVAALLGAPAARGLFHQAIIASGISDSSSVDLATAKATGRALADALGIDATADAFARVSSEAVAKAQTQLEGGRSAGPSGLMWGPTRDGGLIATESFDRERMRVSDDVAVLVGTTLHEFGWVFTRSDLADPRGPAVAERMFRRPTQAFVEARAEACAPTFRYEFRWESTAAPGIGSAHPLDVPFIFNTLRADGVEDFTGPHPPQHLADEVHEAFARFARVGDPGWPRWTREHPAAHVFDGPGAVEFLHV